MNPVFKRLPKEYLFIGSVLFLLLMTAFYDVFFLGKTFKVTTANSQAIPEGVYEQAHNKPPFIPVNGTDSPVSEEPIYEFIRQNLRQGILPLWNPHQACGYPLIGMIEVGLFFPLSLIMYLLPSLYSWDVLILSRFFLGGLFTYCFMRSMRFSKWPSLTSAVIFMFSGPMILLQYWTANVDIMTPLVLIGCERLIRKTTPPNLAFLAVVIALTILGGHPEHIFLVSVYSVLFFIYRLLLLKPRQKYFKTLVYFLFSYIVGICLSAIVLFPFMRNMTSEFWSGHPPQTGLRMEEQRDRILTLALPHFFQQVPLTYDWVFSGWWGGYLGILPLGLSFLSLFHNHKRGLNYYFAIIAFLIIGKEYGLAIINWIGYLPLFDLCRYAIHTPHLAALTIAFLGGMGLRSILTFKKTFFQGMLFSLILLLIVFSHLVILRNSNTFSIHLKATLFAIFILSVFQLLLFLKDKHWLPIRVLKFSLLLLIFLELFLYIHRERPRRFDSFPKVPYIEFLKSQSEKTRSYGVFWAFYPNTATGFRVDDLGYFLGLVPKRFVHFVNHLVIKNHFKNDMRPPALRAIPILENFHILDLLNVRFIIAPSTNWISTPGLFNGRLSQAFTYFDYLKQNFPTLYSKEVNIFERQSAFPRVFIVHRAIFEPNEQKTLMALKNMGISVRIMAVINHPPIPTIKALLDNTPVVDRSQANIVRYTANEVMVDAYLENPGFLVFSDAYHPDWKVYVNGEPKKIYQTDYLIRSVFLSAGNHRLRFVFAPLSFYGGAILSLLTLVVIPFLLFGHKLRKFQNKERL